MSVLYTRDPKKLTRNQLLQIRKALPDGRVVVGTRSDIYGVWPYITIHRTKQQADTAVSAAYGPIKAKILTDMGEL